MALSENYALTRVEIADSGTFGWQVRLQRRGVKYGKFFADGQYGGGRESWVAAKQWRDALVGQLSEKKELRVSARSVRNQSGVVGVSRIRINAPNGVSYEFWQASWSPHPGVRKTLKFSVREL